MFSGGLSLSLKNLYYKIVFLDFRPRQFFIFWIKVYLLWLNFIHGSTFYFLLNQIYYHIHILLSGGRSYTCSGQRMSSALILWWRWRLILGQFFYHFRSFVHAISSASLEFAGTNFGTNFVCLYWGFALYMCISLYCLSWIICSFKWVLTDYL